MNDDATLYSSHSDLQERDANYFLDKYLKFLKWQPGDCVLDVGAGEGSVSLEVLLPKLPSNFNTLTLSDISEKLLDKARKECNNKKINFCRMDISSAADCKDFHQCFDHVFSFYCLNWLVDESKHQQAMKNIFDMLRPGGDVLFTIMCRTPTYDIWEELAKIERWSSFTKNIKNVVPLYHHLTRPIIKLTNFLKNARFEIRVCSLEERLYTYKSLGHCLNAGLAVDPFFKKFNEVEKIKYIEDYKREISKHKFIKVEDAESGVTLLYNVLVVCASKPLLSS